MAGGIGDDTQWGGPGNDRIFANRGADTTYGGPGNDDLWALAPRDAAADSPGVDTILGEEGDDVIRTRDGEPDLINCGPGEDTALLDGVDVIEDATPSNANGSCETVVRAAPSVKDQQKEQSLQSPPDEDKQS